MKGRASFGGANCKYNIPEPGDSDPSQPSWVEIDIDGIGDPASALQQWQQEFGQQKASAGQYPDQFLDYSEGQIGGAKCYFDGNQFTCAKGHWLFTVLGQDTMDSGGGDAAYAEITGYVEQIEANVAKTIALRMT